MAPNMCCLCNRRRDRPGVPGDCQSAGLSGTRVVEGCRFRRGNLPPPGPARSYVSCPTSVSLAAEPTHWARYEPALTLHTYAVLKVSPFGRQSVLPPKQLFSFVPFARKGAGAGAGAGVEAAAADEKAAPAPLPVLKPPSVLCEGIWPVSRLEMYVADGLRTQVDERVEAAASDGAASDGAAPSTRLDIELIFADKALPSSMELAAVRQLAGGGKGGRLGGAAVELMYRRRYPPRQ